MYCVKCGVELADSERVCPLCGTRVFHPDLPCGQGEPPYPPEERPRREEVSRIGALFVLSMCMLLPAVICVLVDWRVNGGIVWSGFAVGGLLLLWRALRRRHQSVARPGLSPQERARAQAWLESRQDTPTPEDRP